MSFQCVSAQSASFTPAAWAKQRQELLELIDEGKISNFATPQARRFLGSRAQEYGLLKDIQTSEQDDNYIISFYTVKVIEIMKNTKEFPTWISFLPTNYREVVQNCVAFYFRTKQPYN